MQRGGTMEGMRMRKTKSWQRKESSSMTVNSSREWDSSRMIWAEDRWLCTIVPSVFRLDLCLSVNTFKTFYWETLEFELEIVILFVIPFHSLKIQYKCLIIDVRCSLLQVLYLCRVWKYLYWSFSHVALIL